jgi:hypothetical protein
MRAEHYIQKAFISPFLSKLDRCYHKCSNQTNHAAIFLFRINHHRSLRCGLFVLVIVHYFHPYDYLAVAAYKTVPFSFSRQSNRCCEGIQFDGCDAVKRPPGDKDKDSRQRAHQLFCSSNVMFNCPKDQTTS